MNDLRKAKKVLLGTAVAGTAAAFACAAERDRPDIAGASHAVALADDPDVCFAAMD